MKPIVELNECLKDSPRFRSSVEEAEEDVDQLEQKLDRLVKLCTSMIDAGKAFVNSKSSFIGGMVDLSTYFKDDFQVASAINKLILALNEMLKYQSILIDQAHRSICKNLNNFIRNDIRSLRETKRCFEKISDEYDQALLRNSQVPRSKPHECEDMKNNLTAVRSCFQHTALDYVNQMSLLHGRKRHEILDTLLSFMRAKCTYFHQGVDLGQDIESLMKQLSTSVSEMRQETNQLEKQLEGRHTLVSSKNFAPTTDIQPANGTHMEGYLFKRTSNAFKTWNRRWFIIKSNRLVYRKRCRDDYPTVMEDDLRLCTVKPAMEVDRRFCFEVLSPSKSHMLQADSDEAFSIWLKEMQESINAALQQTDVNDRSSAMNPDVEFANGDAKVDGVGDPVKIGQPLLQWILEVGGNDKCCDCKSPDPRWASINLGITLCIECSGIHRSLGVHYSKVRSLTLDAWEPEAMKIMTNLGNNVVNEIYENNVEKPELRAAPDCSRPVREAWIKAKYIQKAFVRKVCRKEPKQWLHRQRNIRKGSVPRPLVSNNEESPKSPTVDSVAKSIGEMGSPSDNSVAIPNIDKLDGDKPADTGEEMSGLEQAEVVDDEVKFSDEEESDQHDPNFILYNAAAVQNVALMCEAIAQGADVNWINHGDEGKTVVHQAITSGSVLACEYLFLNGAKTNVKDSHQRTPIHLATQLGNTGQVCLLLKRGADQHAQDDNGQDALAVAMEKGNADIVTLLRLAKLNEEMKENEYGNPDEMFNEVVKDFSKLASDTPEKLRRKHTDGEEPDT